MAHNLLRSFSDVDTTRTAITGISWGGVITCIVVGLDNRYKVAVPVYGCGYLAKSGRMKKQLNQLNLKDKKTWVKQYDPSQYIEMSTTPMLFINDADDPYFTLRSYMKTYNEVKNKNLCIKINLKHGHQAGWSSRDIYYFINSYINKTTKLPVISNVLRNNHRILIQVHSTVNITKAFLNYTTDTSNSGTNSRWKTVKAILRESHIIAHFPPKKAKIWYLSLKDERGLSVSGPVEFTRDK